MLSNRQRVKQRTKIRNRPEADQSAVWYEYLSLSGAWLILKVRVLSGRLDVVFIGAVDPVLYTDTDAPFVWLDFPGCDQKKCRLSGTRRTNNGRDLPMLQFEVEMFYKNLVIASDGDVFKTQFHPSSPPEMTQCHFNLIWIIAQFFTTITHHKHVLAYTCFALCGFDTHLIHFSSTAWCLLIDEYTKRKPPSFEAVSQGSVIQASSVTDHMLRCNGCIHQIAFV
jgi:hypothetical protein